MKKKKRENLVGVMGNALGMGRFSPKQALGQAGAKVGGRLFQEHPTKEGI